MSANEELVRRLRGLASQIDGEEFVPDAVDAARIDAAANFIEGALSRSASGPIPGHYGTRWSVGPDGKTVTLAFDNIENMDAYLAVLRGKP